MADSLTDLYGIPYYQLRKAEGMQALDAVFCSWLQNKYPERAKELKDFRSAYWTDERYEAWLMDFAPLLREFLAFGFQVQEHLAVFHERSQRDSLVYRFQRECLKKLKHQAHSQADWITPSFIEEILTADDPEYALAAYWELADAEKRDTLQAWCWQALQKKTLNWPVFQLPERLNLNELIPTERQGDTRIIDNKERLRRGFDLTDSGMSRDELQNEAHYCVYCHDKQGDFCSRGFPVKKNETPLNWRSHATGELMLGCPLEEKISQMHKLYSTGDLLAAFAVIMIDNPLCALTGHRICNDCMKACIYQKQTPVNTPEVETGILMQVLQLPWGVEIYDILMRWNPMRRKQAIEKSYNGKKIWVMGLGPSGISVAHHLLMAGCGVVAADGMRIQGVPEAWCENPIKDIATIWEPLSKRPIRGFGGVAEYGITVRWNKNFLTLIQLLFQRRPYLSMLGDIRFGGTVCVEDIWDLGFDHLCLAVGAGLPRELRIPGSLAPGMRQANDFLMALHLTAAGRPQSQSTLQLRLPILVIGGGLTGVDTATEAQAYYIEQIELVERRFSQLTLQHGVDVVWARFTPEEQVSLKEWLSHAKDWHSYQLTHKKPDIAAFLRRYGGVSIVYRKRLEDSPAYRHNHEELEKALEEGVHYVECFEPQKALCDETGAIQSMQFVRMEKSVDGWHETTDEILLPARSVLCATGATPNIAYEFEHRGNFTKRNGSYRSHRWLGDHLVLDEREIGHCKSESIGMFTSYNDGKHRVSLLGDAHPWFHGSVVKAIASGQVAWPQIMSSIESLASDHDFDSFRQSIETQFSSILKAINPIHKTIHEWIVYSPWLAKKHKPGQFYRVSQGFNSNTEPLALLGSLDPAHPDCLIFWVTKKDWTVGQPICVMGPTGAWTKVGAEKNETIVVIGSLLAAIYLRSVAPTWKHHGHRVIWINTGSEKISKERLLDSVDEIICESPLTAMLCVNDPDAVHVIGDKELLCRIQSARHHEWKNKLKEDIYWVGSTYGPMQCMLKGVCAQCLQWQLDPHTGKRKKAVYACSWQHQPMDLIDLNHLGERQQLNSILDKLIQGD